MSGFKDDKNKVNFGGKAEELTTKNISEETDKTLSDPSKSSAEENVDAATTANSTLDTKDENSSAEDAALAGEIENITAEDIEDETENELVVHLSKRIAFEGKEISEIDISGIKNLGAKDLKKVEKIYRKNTENLSAAPETTLEYAIAMASYLTGLPVGFLNHIPAADSVKLKNRVINFLFKD